MADYVDQQVRVRYAETDQMGIAYYANYLVWFEVGRAEFCRRRGFSYAELERRSQRFLTVAEARCRYRVPLRYDTLFVVRTRLTELRRRVITFGYQLIDIDGQTLFAEGETKHVVTDPQGRPRKFPQPYWEKMQQIPHPLGES